MIFNSDYPQVYIAKTFSASGTTIDVGYGVWNKTISIPHNLPFAPLIRGVWSDDPNFTWANDLSIYSKTRFGNFPDIALTGYRSDSNNIYLDCASGVDVPVTFYVKGILIPPPNFMGDIAEFDTIGEYKFNSDKKYNKLFASGELPVGGGVVNHNLGYAPVCWVFEKSPHGSLAINKVKVNEQSLIVQTPNGATDNGFYYFIMKDGYRGEG